MPVLWRELPALLDDVGGTLASIDQGYADFLAEERPMVTAAAQEAIRELVEGAEQQVDRARGGSGERGPEPPGAAGQGPRGFALSLFEEAGRDHAHRNLPLLTLLLAYRAGGRVAWRHISASAVQLGMPADALAALAEAVFRAVDEISALSTNGYLLEQAESAGMREQLLNALAEQLLLEGTEPATLQKLARQAGWTLPAEAAVVLVRPDDQAGPRALARLTPPALHVRWGAFPGVIVPDASAPGTRQRLAAVLRGCAGAVGPTVPLRSLPDSARITRDAAAWIWETPWGGQRPFFVDEHLDAVIVHRDERLLDALRARSLAPLQLAAKGSRTAFRDTLRSWLVHMGDRRAVAAELQVHPQTVRYRMSRLQELFGAALDDPDGRLRLLLALAWDEPVGARRPAAEPARRAPGEPGRSTRSSAGAVPAARRPAGAGAAAVRPAGR